MESSPNTEDPDSDPTTAGRKEQGKQKIYQRFINSIICASNDPRSPKKTWTKKCLECLKPSGEEPTVAGQSPERETWGNRCTFFMTALGTSVGLGQVWRFPVLAYRYGGGSFLLLYGIMIFFFGNVLVFFEIANGQYSSKNPLKVYDKVPFFQGVGWSMITYSYLFCTYYSHMVSFSLYYLLNSFNSVLPWTFCQNNQKDFPDSYHCMPYPKHRKPDLDGIICGGEALMYNRTQLCSVKEYADNQKTNCCKNAKVEGDECDNLFRLEDLCAKREYPSEYYWNHCVNRVYREDDENHGYLGGVNSWLLGCSFLAWFISYLVLYKGIKSLGVLMYVMVPLPYIVLIIMFGVVIPQEGATFGLQNFFEPKVAFLTDINVWRIATEQAFYSIGVSMGPMITFGSYSKFTSPSHIDGALICFCIFMTSVLCSLVVFSVLGFLSVKTGRPFDEVAEPGPGLVFIVYPEALDLLPASAFFSILFYLMIMNLGLSTITGIIETTPSAIYDFWPKSRKYKYLVNMGVLFSCFLFGLPITLRGGLYVYNAFDVYSAGLTLIPICVVELIVIVYIYGLARFCEDIEFMIGFYPNRFYRYQWMIGPFFLTGVFIYGLVVMVIPDLRTWAQIVGWMLFSLVLGFIPVGMIYHSVNFGKEKNWKGLFKPLPDHGPYDESSRKARAEFKSKKRIW